LTMKFNKIALAACMAATGFSAHAALSSAASTLIADATANNRVMFISGASAVQKGFQAIVANMVTGDTYFNNDGTTAVNGSGYVAVAGNLSAAVGSWPVGAAVIVIYRNSGGSVYGVNPVARNQAIQSLLIDSTCGSVGDGSALTPYKCTSSSATTLVPDAGMSDVAPVFFTNPVNTEGEVADTALTTAERALLTSKPMYAQAFGIPVTSTVPAAAVFNRASVSAIMSGAISNWSKVPGAGTGPIVICRRTPGSGSQAVVNMWTGNYPCSSAAQLPLNRDANASSKADALDANGDPILDANGNPTFITIPGVWDASTRTYTAANTNGNTIVIENDSSGNVRTCLDKAVVGGSYTAKDRSGNAVTVDFGTGGYKAIGVLSLDSMTSSKAAGNWQFRSLDGAGKITGDTVNLTTPPVTTGTGTFPTIEALTTGDWSMEGWTSFNIPSRTIGDKLAFMNAFLAQAQSPAVLASAVETKWTAAKIATGANTDPQTLKVKYVNNNQCAPLNRQY
jgi:hypothetical protein